MSNTLCPTRDRDVPSRQCQWEAMPQGAQGEDSAAEPVSAAAMEQPPRGSE